MEIKTRQELYDSVANNSCPINDNWVRVDDEFINLVRDVIVYYNKEYQKHPFKKTHKKCMDSLEFLSKISSKELK